jgi:hypothetical protein
MASTTHRGRHAPLASDPFDDMPTAKLIDLKRSIDDRIAERRSVGGANSWGRNEGWKNLIHHFKTIRKTAAFVPF